MSTTELKDPTITPGPRARRYASVEAKHLVTKVVLYLALALIVLMYVFPAFWLVTSAFKADTEVYRWPPQWIPTSLHWENFANAFNNVPFLRFVINSIVVSVIGTLLVLYNACMSSYALVFIKFKYAGLVFLFFIGALLLPGDLHLIPNYITIANLRWLDTYQGLIIPTSAAVLGTFLLRQNMKTIPREIIDAAKMDRAGHLTMLTRIVLPMCRPMVVTIAIVTLIGEWNRFIWPLIITNSNDLRVLPIGLLYLMDQEGTQNWGAIMAGTLMTALPMIIAFIFAQKQIIQGLTRTTTMK